MPTVEDLLREIKKLPQRELEELIKELLASSRPVSVKRRISGKYTGIGKGIWKEDAQEYVKKGRSDNRA